MPTPKKIDLKDRLSHYRQIKISVIGRKSGQTISIPVWFVLEGEKLYLLPVQGSDTQWYKNVLQNPQIRIDARGKKAELRAMPITEAKAVKSVVEKFREKYGAKDVKKIIRNSMWRLALSWAELECPYSLGAHPNGTGAMTWWTYPFRVAIWSCTSGEPTSCWRSRVRSKSRWRTLRKSRQTRP